MPQPEVKFATAPRMIVASIGWRGPYSGIAQTMLELKGWIESRGIEQAGHPFCMFYDNPFETPGPRLRSEACIPVSKPFEPEGEVEMKSLGETQVAETRHSGPPEDFGRTYGPFLEGLLDQGYRIVGPAREYFVAASDVKGPGSGFLIQQPVSKR